MKNAALRLARFYARPFARPRLGELVFFVTSRCASRCRGCFYAARLNRAGELSLAEVERIADRARPLDRLMLSGGEPFLREDLIAVCRAFVASAGVSSIVLPAGGTAPGSAETLAALLDAGLDTDVALCVSVDGLAKIHRALRGTPLGPTLDFLESALALRAKRPRLRVHVQTVVNAANRAEMPALAAFVAARFPVDGHGFDVIRGNPPDRTLLLHDGPLREALALCEELNRPNWRTRFQRAFHARTSGACRRAAGGDGWGFPCLAGDVVAVLDADGSVSGCELKPALGSIRAHDYDIRKLLRTPAARAFRREARRCGCSHPCFVVPSAFFSPVQTGRVLASLVTARGRRGEGRPSRSKA
jgi:MoaA/NifB/PqqE/SkfB family radical SAM enzyme